MADPTDCQLALAFLTVVEHEPHGLFGGYLLLNLLARPIEFYCTAPVKPNRAQQILFGPTLQPYLYGEHIGATLVKKSPLTPLAVLVDVAPVLAVRSHVNLPVALVCDEPTMAKELTMPLVEFSLGQNRLAVQQVADREAIIHQLAALTDVFDLREPFGRIREAIDEAQRAGQKAA
jgi:hypothetical protein